MISFYNTLKLPVRVRKFPFLQSLFEDPGSLNLSVRSGRIFMSNKMKIFKDL